MKLWLAPMEGVVDAAMREFMSRIGGIDHFVTEFIRVTDKLVPDPVLLKYCPELENSSRTSTGVPVSAQLLGGQPEPLAENARRLVDLGALAIDLNFGCPAKTVNRHDGGASLLKHPDRLYKIVSAVRSALPSHIPVTAKMRLGYDTPTGCIAIAQALSAGGAAHITVHCRTKTDMYKAPAYWEWLPLIRDAVTVPIIANGEIWSKDDLDRCRNETGCEDFMIGRGALRDPFIFLKIRGQFDFQEMSERALPLAFFNLNQARVSAAFAQARTKQWLRYRSQTAGEFATLFENVKITTDPTKFETQLREWSLFN